jgi:hypothetical protein
MKRVAGKLPLHSLQGLGLGKPQLQCRNFVHSSMRTPFSSGRTKKHSFSTNTTNANPTPNRPTPVLDFLEVHGGKVAIVGLGVATYLIYTYYLGIEERRNVEEAVEHRALAEPYELLQLRYANNLTHQESESESESESENSEDGFISNTQRSSNMTRDHSFSFSLMEEIIQEFQDVPIKDTTISYRDFVNRSQAVIRRYRQKDFQRRFPGATTGNNAQQGARMTSSGMIVISDNNNDNDNESQQIGIQCGYLLDRMVQKKIIYEIKKIEEQDSVESMRLTPKCYADFDNILTIDYFLVLLQQALPQHHYKQRIHLLFDMMRLTENNNAHARDHEESGRHAENDGKQQNSDAETVSRGE